MSIFEAFLYDKDKQALIENICQEFGEKIENRAMRDVMTKLLYETLQKQLEDEETKNELIKKTK